MSELESVRELAHEFAMSELRPHVEAWDRDRAVEPAVVEQLAELGFFGMLVPEAHGGLGFELPVYLAALEELAWGEPAVALSLSTHSGFAAGLILDHGSDAQKERWLGALASGSLGCFALSEAEASSDYAAVQTRARRDGEQWVLSGEKRWVANGGAAALAVVIARTGDGSDGSRELSAFLVPTDVAGYRVLGREETMGLRAAEIVTVALDDVVLDAGALLGEEGEGVRLASEGLNRGRLGMAAVAVGIARAALDHSLAYADERRQFGRSIREFEAIQFKLADMATRVAAARALVDHAATSFGAATVAMAKLFASEAAMHAATEAVQIYGGYGYMRDYPVEKLMRDAKATEICEGTNEIQRVVIAHGLYSDG